MRGEGGQPVGGREKSAASPAVLFEAGLIVNRGEELVLASPETRRRIAESVSQGLAACLRPSKGAP